MANVKLIDFGFIYDTIMEGVVNGINQVGEHAEERAKHDVPIRKIFKYGRTRTGARFQGRQDVHTLSPGEVRRERGRTAADMGYSMAETGPTPSVRTTLFPGNYRTINRANDERSLRRRETAMFAEYYREGPGLGVQKTRFVRHLIDKEGNIDREAEADLSSQGRAELRLERSISGPTGDRLGGALHDSIMSTPAAPGPRPKFVLAAGGEAAPYAKYVEFGTRHAKAQPFLRPALAQAREELLKTVLEHIKLAAPTGR